MSAAMNKYVWLSVFFLKVGTLKYDSVKSVCLDPDTTDNEQNLAFFKTFDVWFFRAVRE